MLRTLIIGLITVVALSVLAVPALALLSCPKDSVPSGDTCVDAYEASVWEIPVTKEELIKKVQIGIATEAALLAGGATLRGVASDDYGAGCPDTGNGCTDFYAVSIPGVKPARFITWFQAAAACRNALKRLLTNQEWQVAALGTPDTGGADNGTTTCNTDDPESGVVATGSRSACVSDVGAYDMVGNVWEWVADWVPRSTACPGWGGGFSDDDMCLAGASTTGGPGALIRGGRFGGGTGAGVFAVSAGFEPSSADFSFGFRCGR